MSLSDLALTAPSVLMNVLLVNAEIRPAMMVQPADLGEWNASDPKTEKILQIIKTHFPLLKYSDNYDWFQGIIISKHHNYNGRNNIDSNEMGHILGYPCPNDFTTIINNEADIESIDIDNQYVMSVEVKTDNGNIPLIANRCIGNDSFTQFQDIAQKAEKELKNIKYAELFDVTNIHTVDAISNKLPSVNNIIHALIHNERITEEYKDEMINYIWNLGDNDMLSEVIIDKLYEPANHIHNGMLIMIMLKCSPKLSRESPIFGKESSELTHMGRIYVEWFDGIIHFFKATKCQEYGIIDRIKSFMGLSKAILPNVSDPLVNIIGKVFKRQPLDTSDCTLIHKRMMKVSDKNPQDIYKITTLYDPINPVHIGMMMVLLLQLIPKYDTTIPLQKMQRYQINRYSNEKEYTYEYYLFKKISDAWMRKVVSLFEQTDTNF